MKAVSFWGLCRVAILNYVDRMARNMHRHAADSDLDIFSPAIADRMRRKRIAVTISAQRIFRSRADVKAPAKKPLAGVGVNGDD